MNKDEVRQQVRDMETVREAVDDAKSNEYHPRITLLDTFLPGEMSDEKIHDHEVYNEAHREARKN